MLKVFRGIPKAYENLKTEEIKESEYNGYKETINLKELSGILGFKR